MHMYRDHVRQKTLQDWKFWIFSHLTDPLAESFNNSVSTASLDDLFRTTSSWAEQHCALVALRPSVLASLRQLSTNTSILSNPLKLAEEAADAVSKQEVHEASNSS
ncbi:unnamed protein product [Notodromas monacha]|uniref:Uncharacterized protein n=1 Tax=Notodromas monacha TaxID=399045 RepID=A0A7R9GE88_9CRUS|nr:unnamed protein product [Notodromas monacha]CAG0918005.1 unnamed protein product [Notodromas monacha]